MRLQNLEARRVKQREIIAPLKKVYEDHDRDWFTIEQQIREELEAKKAEHRRQVLLALRKAAVAGYTYRQESLYGKPKHSPTGGCRDRVLPVA